MFKVTWKGLIAHKLRFVLTGIAVILGVSFISGTFVFTATIQHPFDDLIANIGIMRKTCSRNSGSKIPTPIRTK